MSADAENAEWYYLRGDEPEGPVSAKTLRSMSYGKMLDADTLVWNEGYGDHWKRFSDSEIVEHSDEPVPFYRRIGSDWYAVAGVVLAIATVLSIFIYLSVFKRSAEEQALREGFIRLGVSLEHGVSLRTFSDNIIDIQTKYELAQSHMNREQKDTIREAISKLSAVSKLWSTIAFNQYCPSLCKDQMLEPMMKLEMLEDEKGFGSYHFGNLQDNTGRQQFTSRLLLLAAIQTLVARHVLE